MLRLIEWSCDLADKIDKASSEWAAGSTARRFLVFMTWMVAYFGAGICIGGFVFVGVGTLIYKAIARLCAG